MRRLDAFLGWSKDRGILPDRIVGAATGRRCSLDRSLLEMDGVSAAVDIIRAE